MQRPMEGNHTTPVFGIATVDVCVCVCVFFFVFFSSSFWSPKTCRTKFVSHKFAAPSFQFHRANRAFAGLLESSGSGAHFAWSAFHKQRLWHSMGGDCRSGPLDFRDLSLQIGDKKRSDLFKKPVLSLDDFFDGWIEWERPCLHSNWALQTKSNPFPPLGSAAWKLPFSGHSLIPFPGLSLQRERGRVQGSIAATLGSESIVLEDTLKDVWCSTCFGPWWQWRCLQCT